MLCPNCGHQSPSESLFCASCGASLATSDPDGAVQDPTVVDTFAESESGAERSGAAGAAGVGAAGIGAVGAEPWGTQVNEPVSVDPGEGAAPWQEPDPTTAMPATTAIPTAGAAGAGAAIGAAAAVDATGGVPPGPPPGPPPDEDPADNRGWIIAIVILVLLLIAAIIAFFVTRDSGDSTSTTSTTSTSSTTSSSTTSSSTSSSTTSTSTTSTSTTSTTAPTTTTTAPTTTTTAPKPTITSFTVPAKVTDAQCPNNASTATITVSWVTANTKSVTIGIANPQPYEQDLPSTGSIQVPFACSNGTNTYYITAFGNDGSTAVQSKDVTFTPAP